MSIQQSYAMAVSKKHSVPARVKNKQSWTIHYRREISSEPKMVLTMALGMVTDI